MTCGPDVRSYRCLHESLASRLCMRTNSREIITVIHHILDEISDVEQI